MNVVALSLSCFMCVFLLVDDTCFMTQRFIIVFCGCKINKKVRKRLLFLTFCSLKITDRVWSYILYGFKFGYNGFR